MPWLQLFRKANQLYSFGSGKSDAQLIHGAGEMSPVDEPDPLPPPDPPPLFPVPASGDPVSCCRMHWPGGTVIVALQVDPALSLAETVWAPGGSYTVNVPI